MVSRLHYACPTCRVAVKDVPSGLHTCGQPMVAMGKNFRAPRKNNKSQWRKVALAVQTAYDHHPSCWYSSHYSELEWKRSWMRMFCNCASFRDYKTVSDVKSAKGVRRSRRKNYAPGKRAA